MAALRMSFAVATLATFMHAERNGLTISPKMALRNWFGNISITCNSSFKIKECQFRVWVEELRYQWDFTVTSPGNGSKHRTTGTGNDFKLFDYNYDGQGLAEGRCVLSLSRLKTGRYFVGCRVLDDSSGWSYTQMAFVVLTSSDNKAVEFNEIHFKELVVEPDKKNVDIEFETTGTKDCSIFYPNQTVLYSEIIAKKSRKTVETIAIETNLQPNVCDALFDLTRHTSGIVWCIFKSLNDGSKGETSFDLVITKLLAEPRPPVLTTSNSTFTAGKSVTARCTVEGARPVARIVWALGDKVVRNDSDDDQVDRAWSWPWDVKSITQELTRNLTEEDDGKNLTCKVFYPNTSVLWWSESVFIGTPKYQEDKSANILDVNTWTMLVVGMVILLLLTGLIIVVARRRRIRADAITADKPTNARTSFVEDNDLYLSNSDPCFANLQPQGARPCDEDENPYEEVTLALTASQPPAALALYNNTVQYEEVLTGSTDGGHPPPKKPFKEEACVYSEVVKEPSACNNISSQKSVNPEAVYAEVIHKNRS